MWLRPRIRSGGNFFSYFFLPFSFFVSCNFKLSQTPLVVATTIYVVRQQGTAVTLDLMRGEIGYISCLGGSSTDYRIHHGVLESQATSSLGLQDHRRSGSILPISSFEPGLARLSRGLLKSIFSFTIRSQLPLRCSGSQFSKIMLLYRHDCMSEFLHLASFSQWHFLQSLRYCLKYVALAMQ